MGDARFERAYRRAREARERGEGLACLDDEPLVEALAAASRHADPLLANVLGTEALNRLRRLRAALAHLGQGIVTADTTGRVTWINPAGERLLRWRREELLHQEFHAVVPHLDADKRPVPRDRCALVAALRDGRVRREGEWFRRRDGTLLCVAYTASPTVDEDGSPFGTVAVFEDIGPRVAREQELAEAREWYRSLFSSSPVPAVSVTPEGVIMEPNRSLERLTDRPAALARGRPIEAFLHPDDAPRVLGLFLRVVQGEEQEADFRILHRDGHYVDVHGRGVPIRVDERVVGIQGLLEPR